MKRSIFLMIFLGSFFTVLGQTEYPVTQPTQKINESPWYGLGLSNSTFSGASGSAVQLAGYYGLLFKTGNGQFSFLQNGNVGIGTTNPKTKLQVAGDFSSGYNNILSLDSNEWFNFGNISGHGYINWFSKANADKSGFINTHSSQKASSIRGGFGEIEFFTSSTNNGANQPSELVERMVINSDGNVGIGTANPEAKLDVNGYVNASSFSVISTEYNSRLSSNMLQFSRNGFSYIDNKDSNGSIAIRTGGTENIDLLIKSDGNVGIGTTNPIHKFDVHGNYTRGVGLKHVMHLTNNNALDAGDGTSLLFTNRLADYGGYIALVSTNSNPTWLNPRLDFGVQNTGTNDLTNMTTKMSILGNGNIGIGTTNPTAKLHVNNGNNSYGAILANSSETAFSLYTKTITTDPNTETFRLGLKYNTDENNGFISFYRGADTYGGYLGFSTNGTERLKIDASGNVGIGTANPNATLQVGDSDNMTVSSEVERKRLSLAPVSHSGSDWFFTVRDNNPYANLDIGYSNNKTLTLRHDGNVGIGTKNPEGNLQIGSSTTNGMVFLGGKGHSGIGSTRSDGGLVLGWNIYARYNDESDNWKARVAETKSGLGYSGIKITHRGVIDFFGHNGSVTEDEIANTDERVRMRINESGNVGIGTITPTSKLEVKGDFSIGDGSNYDDLVFKTGTDINGYNGVFEIKPKTLPGSGTAQQMTYFKDSSHSNGKTVHNVIIDGKLGIGTTNPDAKLAVNGTIHTKEVKVDLQGWPDYVFAKEYKLLSVEEVAKYIKENGHLPKMPSAKEVEKNGVLLGEINKKLLEKIEELTLYTIEQEKEIKKLRNQEERIDKLEQENKQLKNLLDRVSKLEKQLERK